MPSTTRCDARNKAVLTRHKTWLVTTGSTFKWGHGWAWPPTAAIAIVIVISKRPASAVTVPDRQKQEHYWVPCINKSVGDIRFTVINQQPTNTLGSHISTWEVKHAVVRVGLSSAVILRPFSWHQHHISRCLLLAVHQMKISMKI